MPYQIFNIKGYSPEEYPFYFFDANVWIAKLKSSNNLHLDTFDADYLNLFDAIITLQNHPPAIRKKIKGHIPKIVMTSMLLSEIINTYMRKISMRNFYPTGPIDPNAFKNFRKQLAYKKDLLNLISDIQAFDDYVYQVDDDFGNVYKTDILSSLSRKAMDHDFNDYYYYHLFKNKGIAIVTRDSDFTFEDQIIVTGHPDLLKLSR
ncbi:hypothetical protein GO730_26605 [Spirosoma sp. HMF3257]|uniref:PIN domain-containing protein n=1 Tax=Spirosoma telluris TaxID=2183553 RepID=A0A327NNC8_9BACT|nr:hypothetical protein [Spirosoma telluris]RAI76840.1 hypothetical protein HMF3257_26535 [Spirosoma telluris]